MGAYCLVAVFILPGAVSPPLLAWLDDFLLIIRFISQMSNILALHREEIEMRPSETAPEAGEEGVQNNRPSWFQRWRKGFSNLVNRMDTGVAKSPVGRIFRLKGGGHVSSCSHATKALFRIVPPKMSR